MQKTLKDIITRSLDILFKPESALKKIGEEPSKIKSVLIFYFFPYLSIIAAAKITSSMWTLFSKPAAFFLYNLVEALVISVVVTISTFLSSIVINEVSKGFGGEKSFLKSLNLVVYSLTPFYIFYATFVLIPSLWFLPVGGLYGVFLIYKGCGYLLKINEERKVGFALVSFLIFAGIYGIIQFILLVTTRYFLFDRVTYSIF